MASSHDPATCPCNKCSARRSEERMAAAVAAASGQAGNPVAATPPGARAEVVPAEFLAKRVGELYFEGNYVMGFTPSALHIDQRMALAGFQPAPKFSEYTIIYIPKEFL